MYCTGYGLFVLEQLIHSPAGVLLTRGPGAYKIPSFNDVPSGQSNMSNMSKMSNMSNMSNMSDVSDMPNTV